MIATSARRSSLGDLRTRIDWSVIDRALASGHASALGEASWPPLAIFRALLLSVWRDLSDVQLSEALEDRALSRRFCGFSRTDAAADGQPSHGFAARCRRMASRRRCPRR
jgi:IS5 family transposase